MNTYQGTWLRINTPGEYTTPEFIEFDSEKVLFFELLPETSNYKLTKKQRGFQYLSEVKHEFVNENRVRFYVPGKIHTFWNDKESTTTDTIFENDYERISPTKTNLTAKEIELMEFDIIWNEENIHIVFNISIDHKVIQMLNKRQGLEGEKIILEKLQETYFTTLYRNGTRSKLLPINKISIGEIILSGFPELPYEVIGQRVSKN